ncbi:hypothetical protein B0J11DRAFT_503841 [Dendryphion nanum]|uniref:F-box domain-containing protein n=1 Tax=Dendryphion nanum TaxID=256645 RepID=A0A9P9E3F7_9PLEO|nr:hypothetical protein B0J11DRAFT_503841 [Dendryphion nanum]
MQSFMCLRTADLTALALPCRALYAAVTSSLYSTLNFIWDFDDCNTKMPDLVACSKMLWTHPINALRIKRTLFQAINYSNNAHYQERATIPWNARILPNEKRDNIAQAISRLQLFPPDIWTRALCDERDLGALICFVALHCTELEALNIDSRSFALGRGWMLRMFENVILRSAISSMPKLKHFTVGINSEDDEADYVKLTLSVDVESLTNVVHYYLGSLHDFSYLTTLNISLFILCSDLNPPDVPVPAIMFPETLRHLTLNDNLWGYSAFRLWEPENIISLLDSFIKGKSNDGKMCWNRATPGLKSIDLTFSLRGMGWLDEWVADKVVTLWGCPTTKGISVRVIYEDDGY